MSAVDLGVEMELFVVSIPWLPTYKGYSCYCYCEVSYLPDRADTIPSFEKTIQTFNSTLITLYLFHSERIYIQFIMIGTDMYSASFLYEITFSACRTSASKANSVHKIIYMQEKDLINYHIKQSLQ